MLENNEKIQNVNLQDVFAKMLAELPWENLKAYILSNVNLLKMCTAGGFRMEPKQRPRMEKIIARDAERGNYGESACNGVFASWYPIHTAIHEELEDYFHSSEYREFREANSIKEDEYVLPDEKFDALYNVNDFEAWRILLCFSPLKFSAAQAVKITEDKKEDANLLERLKKAEAEAAELSKKVAQLQGEAERLRAKQQSDQNEIQELRRLNRQSKNEIEQLQNRADTAVAEMKRSNQQAAQANSVAEQKEAAIREEMGRIVQRCQSDVERLNKEVVLWRTRHEEQCAQNHGLAEQADQAVKALEVAQNERDSFAAKVQGTHTAIDALLARIDWPKVASAMKPSPTVKRNLNSLLKKLDYNEERSLSIEGTLLDFWSRLNQPEQELIAAIAKSRENELVNGTIQDYWGNVANMFADVLLNMEARLALLGILQSIFFQTFTDEELQEPAPASKTSKAK